MNSLCKALLIIGMVGGQTTTATSASSTTSSIVRRTEHANEFEVKQNQQQQQQQAQLQHQLQLQHSEYNPYNKTAFARNWKRNIQRAPSQEAREEEAVRRRARLQQRRSKARVSLAALSKEASHATSETATQGQAHRITQEQFDNVQRRTSWFGSGGSYSYNAALGYLADPAADYDKWAQAYRMLGAFIDCDHDADGGSGDQNNDNGGGGDDGGEGCSRWMMWAAYVNPNYQGYEYDEYFSEEPYSTLDCHNSDTEWELIGVYRQEFYQFIEQISKHLWAIDDYEYIVARAGLMYMTDADCFQIAEDDNGNAIKAAIAPQPNGRFQMALYSDDYCLVPDETLGTYDDYVAQTDVDLGSKDEGDGDADDLYDWWYDTQEYTLENLNSVYEEYTYCTPCMDYPTYQDGYFIGDYGTDDDDLINQCWKFHSHDSFICEGECIAMGHSQGSINQVMYGDQVFGTQMNSNGYATGSSSSSSGSRNKADVLVESSWSRIMANAFLTFSFLLFVATFLAFAVARRSRYRESRSSKSRRLLDDGHHDDDGGMGGHRSVRSRRSRSRKKNRASSSSRRGGSSRAPTTTTTEGEGDGLFRTSETEGGSDHHGRSASRSRRSKSGTRSGRSRSKSGSKKRSSGSVARKSSRSKEASNNNTIASPSSGDPPSRSGKSSSQRALHDDNF